MKRFLLKGLVLILIVLMSFSITCCNKDDDEIPPESEAEEVYTQKELETTGEHHLNNLVLFVSFSNTQAFSKEYIEEKMDFFFNGEDSLKSGYSDLSNGKFCLNSYGMQVSLPISDLEFNCAYDFGKATKLKNSIMSVANAEILKPNNAVIKNTNFDNISVDVVNNKEQLSYKSDNLIDVVTIIYKSSFVPRWSDLLWPSQSYGGLEKFNGKRINKIVSARSLNTDAHTMVHEFGHVLGAPDLYLYGGENNLSPVGVWDVMSSSTSCMSTYQRKQFGFIDETQLVSENNELSQETISLVDSMSAQGVVGYKFGEIQNADSYFKEYFIIEYRDLTTKINDFGAWQLDDFESGFIIYRVNELYDGNSAAEEESECGIYYFRNNKMYSQTSYFDATFTTVEEMPELTYADGTEYTGTFEFNAETKSFTLTK